MKRNRTKGQRLTLNQSENFFGFLIGHSRSAFNQINCELLQSRGQFSCHKSKLNLHLPSAFCN